MRLHLLVAPAVLVLAVQTPLWAQDPAAAEALFRSAQQAAHQGDWSTACDRFAESNRLDPAPGTVLNLARCHEELGHLATSWKYYQEAAERLPAADQRSAYALRRANELASQVPKIVFEPPTKSEQKPFTLTVNGTVFSSAMMAVEIPFDPGSIVIEVKAVGHQSRVTTLTLKPGDLVTHQVQLGDPVAQPPSEGPERHASKPLAIGLLTVGAAGAAAAIAGGVWAAVELPTANDPEHCVDGACDETGADASRRGRTAVVVLGTGAAIAAIGLGVGSWLLFKNEHQDLALAPRPGGALLTFTADYSSLFGNGRL